MLPHPWQGMCDRRVKRAAAAENSLKVSLVEFQVSSAEGTRKNDEAEHGVHEKPISRIGTCKMLETVKPSITRIGLVWGFLEASMIFLALGVGSGQRLDFVGGSRVGILFAVVVSFVAGMMLADFESTLKALVIASTLALAYSTLVVSVFVLPLPFYSGRFATDLLLIFFVTIATSFFFLGVIAGAFGSVLGSWRRTRRQSKTLRPLEPLKRKGPG